MDPNLKIKRQKYDTLDQLFEAQYTLSITQQVSIFEDGRKHFGQCICSVRLDNRHLLDSWLYNPNGKLRHISLQPQWIIFKKRNFQKLININKYKEIL